MTEVAECLAAGPHPLVSRLADLVATPRARLQPLPVVDWKSVGGAVPRPVEVDYQGPNAPLPAADLALPTWTSAEWSALDHALLTSAQPTRAAPTSWRSTPCSRWTTP
jgi:hypothetical protein